jgi:hypothetical protein
MARSKGDAWSSGSVEVPKESVSLPHLRSEVTWENGM